jgi:hypothetical protein
VVRGDVSSSQTGAWDCVRHARLTANLVVVWKLLMVSVLALVACKKEPPPPPKNEFEAFERKFVHQYGVLAKAMRARGEKVEDKQIPKDYRAVFIGPSGVFIDRKVVATLAEIDTKRAQLETAIDAIAKVLPSDGWSGLVVTFDLDQQPASVAISALRLFAGRETIFNVARQVEEVPDMASQIMCGGITLRAEPPKDARERPTLSVLLDPGVTWVGLSRVNEFQEIPDKGQDRDLDKLETVLKEHKASEMFSERNDIELGAKTGTSEQVLKTFEILCKVGFIDVAVLPRDQLSAVPTL